MQNEDITDRVLAVLQTRFPHHFEIALLQAQNDVLRERVAELDWSNEEDESVDDES